MSRPEHPATDPPVAAAPSSQTEAPHPLALWIAERLGEILPGPLKQIARILHLWGPAQLKALAEEALTLYAGEGMPTLTGDSKRTAGGIFFYLARQQATEEEKRNIPHWLIASPKGARRNECRLSNGRCTGR